MTTAWGVIVLPGLRINDAAVIVHTNKRIDVVKHPARYSEFLFSMFHQSNNTIELVSHEDLNEVVLGLLGVAMSLGNGGESLMLEGQGLGEYVLNMFFIC